MKIIDLLNKIAKGEEVPKKIKYDNYEWVYIDDEYMSHKLQETLFADYIEGNYCVIECLNDEVEVIEEKEIEKLEDYFRGEIWTNDIGQKRLDNNFDTFASKINELIDVINDMRDKE